MSSFVAWLQSVLRSFTPWATVKPWEQGVRVRFGKHVRFLKPGMYWKLPILDSVSVLPIRVRATQLPTQTTMTRDGKALTIGLAMQYQIEDVEKVYRSVHNPEQTLIAWVQGAVGERARTLDSSEITPEALRDAVSVIDVKAMGLGAFSISVTDVALVRTYRLIQDGRWSSGETLDSMGREA